VYTFFNVSHLTLVVDRRLPLLLRFAATDRVDELDGRLELHIITSICSDKHTHARMQCHLVLVVVVEVALDALGDERRSALRRPDTHTHHRAQVQKSSELQIVKESERDKVKCTQTIVGPKSAGRQPVEPLQLLHLRVAGVRQQIRLAWQ
jgi:hypothetical protein